MPVIIPVTGILFIGFVFDIKCRYLEAIPKCDTISLLRICFEDVSEIIDSCYGKNGNPPDCRRLCGLVTKPGKQKIPDGIPNAKQGSI
jgi:hypothetical protein